MNAPCSSRCCAHVGINRTQFGSDGLVIVAHVHKYKVVCLYAAILLVNAFVSASSPLCTCATAITLLCYASQPGV